ncbi:hypothetical protein AHAS_Ahas05G0083300 [Arachis hypogaea]
MPQQSSKPKFAQLYFYDTENEVQNRINAIGQRFTEDSTTPLQLRLIKKRNTDGRRYNLPSATEVAALIVDAFGLIKKRNTDGRRYNLPSATEVAALIVGDFDIDNLSRDVVIQMHSNLLKRVDVNHPQYLTLQYHLLFPYGEDGFWSDILISDERSKQQLHKQEIISMREFLSFQIQMRSYESQVLLKSRRLFQQFLVDSYTMVEAERLQYHRFHQSKFCSHQLQGLHECLIQGETQAARTGK